VPQPPGIKRLRSEFVYKKLLNLNEELVYGEIINNTKRTEMKSVGEYLNGVRRKCENKVRKNSKLYVVNKNVKRTVDMNDTAFRSDRVINGVQSRTAVWNEHDKNNVLLLLLLLLSENIILNCIV
jgi:hypothetical protein